MWDRASAWISLGVSTNSALYPSRSIDVTLYQGFGKGWEVSPGIRHMNFSTDNINIFSLSLGKYVGDWYLGLNGSAIPNSAGESSSVGLDVRRYFLDGRSSLDFSYSHGTTAEEVLDTSDLLFTKTDYFGAGINWWLNDRWGLSLNASHIDDSVFEDQTSIEAGVSTRW